MNNHNTANLLDAVKAKHQLKNDAALSRLLEVAPPVVSKLRSGALPFGAALTLRLIENEIMPLAEIRQFVPRVVA